MNNPIQYNKIFNEQIPISVWINIATILKRVDKITPNYKGNRIIMTDELRFGILGLRFRNYESLVVTSDFLTLFLLN
jgi:hypothetical protein